MNMVNPNEQFSLGVNGSSIILYSVEAAIVQTVTLIIIIVGGMAGNCYVCYIIYGTKHLKQPTMIFILNLAFANIGALTLCTPLPLAFSIKRRFFVDKWLCISSGFLNNLFFCASIFTLSLLTLHKYFTVVKPVSYVRLHLTERRPKLCVFGVWTLCGVMSFFSLGPFTGWNYISFNPTTAHCGISFPISVADKLRLTSLAVLTFLLPLLLMAYAYCRIYCKVNAHERRLTLTGTIRRTSPVKRKLTITLCLMFGTFVACWTPFFLLIVLAIILRHPTDLPVSLGRIAYWFGYINCCLNPVLYCIRTSTFRGLMRGKSTLSLAPTLDNTIKSRKRAFSLPSLPSKRRHSSAVSVALGSVTLSPTKIIVNTRDSNPNEKNNFPNLRVVPRLRACSWTGDYTFAGKMTVNDHQTYSNASRLKVREDIKRLPHSAMNLYHEIIIETPGDVLSQNVDIPLNVLPSAN